MHWLYLLASIVCLLLAPMRSMPTFGVLVLLAGALGFMIAFLLGWLNSRIASGSRDVTHMLSADELRHMREQAGARKAAPQATTPRD